MKSFTRTLYGMLIAFLIASPALAQECDAILRGGAFNESVRTLNYESRDVVMRFACNSASVRRGAAAGAVVYGIPVSGNAYSARANNACQRYNRDRFVSQSDFEFVREASSVLASSWAQCINRDGINISLLQAPDPKQFVVTVGYRKAGEGGLAVSKATLNLVGGSASCTCTTSAGGGTCGQGKSDNEFLLSVRDSGNQSLICKRGSTSGVVFSLDSNVSSSQKMASLPTLQLAPAVVVTPAVRYASGGMCTYTQLPIARFERTVSLYDFETPPPMALEYRGRGSNLGSVVINPIQGFHRDNMRMEADRSSNSSGLYLTVGSRNFWILKQSGNYDCDYDRGKRSIGRLAINVEYHSLFQK